LCLAIFHMQQLISLYSQQAGRRKSLTSLSTINISAVKTSNSSLKMSVQNSFTSLGIPLKMIPRTPGWFSTCRTWQTSPFLVHLSHHHCFFIISFLLRKYLQSNDNICIKNDILFILGWALLLSSTCTSCSHSTVSRPGRGKSFTSLPLSKHFRCQRIKSFIKEVNRWIIPIIGNSSAGDSKNTWLIFNKAHSADKPIFWFILGPML